MVASCQSQAITTSPDPVEKSSGDATSPGFTEALNTLPSAEPSRARPMPTISATPEMTATMTVEDTLEEDTMTSGNANADVEFVRAIQSADGRWTFHVTVNHPDTGWDDYADGWDVVTLEGRVIKRNPGDPFTRLLLHPHENEQPFTRSQSGLIIPDSVSRVEVRAHDIVDGFGGKVVTVDLTVSSGPNFEIERP